MTREDQSDQPYWWFFCDICSQSLDHKLWQKTNIFKILASNQEMGYTHTWHCRTNIVCRWNAQIIRNQLVNCFALHRHCTTDWHRQEAILVSCANTNIDTHTVHNNKCVCVTHTYYYIIISHNIFNFTKDGLLLLLKAKEFWQTLIQLEREINKVRYSLKFYPALSGAQAHGFALLGQIWKEIPTL